MELADLEGFYRDAKKHYDEDEEFAERARNYVVKLQSGDEYFREMWRKLVDITMTQNQITYDRLNVTLTRDDVMGESLYNPMLPGIVADLKAKGLAVESEGATVVFLDEFKTRKANRWALSFRRKMAAISTPPLISPARNIVMKHCMPIACLLHRFPSASTPDAGMGDRP